MRRRTDSLAVLEGCADTAQQAVREGDTDFGAVSQGERACACHVLLRSLYGRHRIWRMFDAMTRQTQDL